MHKYLIKRILMLIPVILGVSFLIFFMIDMAKGNVLDASGEEYTIEEQRRLEHELGLDRSVFYRYFVYMSKLVRGDMGYSFMYKTDVWTIYKQRFPNTFALAISSMLVSLILSIPLGIRAAIKRGSTTDNICTVGSLLGLSIPNFWLGLVLIIVFANGLKWFPAYGAKDGVVSLVLPALTLGTGMMATVSRTTRSSMLDVLRQDYLRTARAKGVTEKTVVRKHALRNALIPIITVVGTQLGHSFGGAVVTENVFAWPGIGQMLVSAIKGRDTILVCGLLIMSVILVVVVQLIIDIIYAFVDPRLKGQYATARSKKKAA